MRALSVVILLIFTTSTVVADTYTIYGIIKYPNNTAVQYEEIQVQCEPHAYDCAKFSGEEGMSDFGGGYRIELPVEDRDEGVSIQLVVRGEIFEHQITLHNETQDGSGHHAMFNITLQQEPPISPLSTGLLCGTLFFILVFANVLVRTGRQLMTPEGRQRFQGRSPMPITTCPVCDGKIRRHLLVRHLIVEHGIPVDKAGAMAGLQFSDERKDLDT